jgi:hypothetical protein
VEFEQTPSSSFTARLMIHGSSGTRWSKTLRLDRHSQCFWPIRTWRTIFILMIHAKRSTASAMRSKVLLLPQAVQILLCLVATDLVLEGFDPLLPL